MRRLTTLRARGEASPRATVAASKSHRTCYRPAQQPKAPMLWKIADSPLHILGAIHCANAPLTLSGEALQALSAAKILAFETSLDAVPDLSAGFFPSGQQLSDVIPPHLFTETQALWSNSGLPDNLNRRRPWLALQGLVGPVFQSWGFDFAQGIDRAVKAGAKGRPLFSLEAAGIPFRCMAEAPLSEQVSGLARLVQQPLEVKAEIESIVEGWRRRDTQALTSAVQLGHGLAPILSAGLYGRRNRAWMPQLLRFARGVKPTVAVVGVLHMVGPDSLVDLLMAEGYSCELIDA